MTREEAINTLNVIKAMLKIYPKRKKQKEAVSEIDTALDMAIEALKGGDAEMSPQTIHMQQSPSDGADRPTWEWVEIGTFKDKNDVTIHVLHCQKCGALHRVRKLYTGEYTNANYCPNCGERMKVR